VYIKKEDKMEYDHVDWFPEMRVTHVGNPIFVSDDKRIVLITVEDTIPHYVVEREVATLGVHTNGAASNPADARIQAQRIALRWFADAAVKHKGNAVIKFHLVKKEDTEDREDGETTYCNESWYTGTVAFVRQFE
jgi:hypothetical protein